jgi:probable HAF family extracellular repeat protein
MKTSRIALLTALATTAVAGGTPAAGTSYEVRVVDFPGATSTFVFAVNNRGQFVGAESDSAGAQHAIFDDGTQLQLLDPTGLIGTSPQSWAFSINNLGEIAGAYQTSSGALHGFIHHPDGTVITLDDPAGTDTQAFGINDLGTVIGIYNDTTGATHAFVLRAGHFTSADIQGGIQTIPFSINDREQIVGELITTAHTLGVGYLQNLNNGAVTLSTAPGSIPQGTFFISINNREQILGAFQPASGPQQNFLESGGNFRPFDLPASLGATFTSAQTINDQGEIVGFYNDASNAAHAFVASPRRH